MPVLLVAQTFLSVRYSFHYRRFLGFVLCTGRNACAPGGTDIPVCAVFIPSRASSLLRVQGFCDVDPEAGEELGLGLLAGAVISELDVLGPFAKVDDDPLLLGVDNPVFVDPGLGVLGFLVQPVPLATGVVGTDDFDNQVGSVPISIAAAVGVLGEHEGEIRFSVPVVDRADSDGSEDQRPQSRCVDGLVECQKKELHD